MTLWRQALRSPQLSVEHSLLLSGDQDVELLVPISICLTTYYCVFHHDYNEINLLNCKPVPIKYFH